MGGEGINKSIHLGPTAPVEYFATVIVSNNGGGIVLGINPQERTGPAVGNAVHGIVISQDSTVPLVAVME
jgi:hypothetical protein